ncbi:MAG: hypothetical protein EBT03_09515 [Betaproteobacteria bacterium]|nr:hypothetical protein [Betaproteobacteria bacterium]NCA16793.1 hypothetical protein [Betaproteobacteria bacterium]
MTENNDKVLRDLIRKAAIEEKLSIRAYCRKYGILYGSLYGDEFKDDPPMLSLDEAKLSSDTHNGSENEED